MKSAKGTFHFKLESIMSEQTGFFFSVEFKFILVLISSFTVS